MKPPCSDPRCPNFARPKSSMCDLHAKRYERERSRRRREKTGGVYKRKIWERRRMQAFERDPQCAWRFEDGTRCERLGMELDHIVPLEAGGEAYSSENLQLLCAEHHRAKTARENRERVSVRAGGG